MNWWVNCSVVIEISEKLQEEKQLVLYTAFSREQNQKVYVQHKIKESGSEVWKLLQVQFHQNFIC